MCVIPITYFTFHRPDELCLIDEFDSCFFLVGLLSRSKVGLRRSTNRERGHGSAICECRAGCGGEGLTTGSRKRMKLSEYKERRRCRDFCIDSYAIRTFECFLFQVARCSCLNCRLSACIPKQVVVNRSITVQEPDVGWDYYIEFHYCTASSSADLGFLLYGCPLAARWSFQIQMRA